MGRLLFCAPYFELCALGDVDSTLSLVVTGQYRNVVASGPLYIQRLKRSRMTRHYRVTVLTVDH